MATLDQLLDTSAVLEEKLASVDDDTLRHKKAMVDFAAFGTFKQSDFWPAAKQGLGWGVGLGLPALGVGLALNNSAKNNANEVVDHARNQALLTGLGLGGIGMGVMAGRRVMASDNTDDLRKLAAACLLDDVLLHDYQQAQDVEKTAVEACLLLNREHGTALLRKLLR